MVLFYQLLVLLRRKNSSGLFWSRLLCLVERLLPLRLGYEATLAGEKRNAFTLLRLEFL